MKKLIRRSLAVILSAVMLLSVFSCISVFASDSYFTKWTDEDAVINGVNHVALDGAPVTDSNYNNYAYAAQTFVPSETNLSGVKLEFNLTAGTATLHVEIREDVNGSAIFSKDIGVESLGNGGYWYTLNFEDNVTLTAGNSYCLVWYATQRTDTSLMINYATDNSANTNPDAYMHGMGTTTFNKASNLTFGFQLITDEYTPFSFAKWTDEDAVINGVSHVALDGAPVTDGNYNNYYYVAQTFIPNSDNISGIKLKFNLTAGTAKIHAEIRSSIDGTALFSKDIDIQSLGNGGNWYTLNFGENFKVTPYESYYLVWYAVDRTASSLMINYATDNASNTNPDAYTHKMGETTFSKASNLTFGFQLITDEYTPFSFAKWTDEDAVINGVNHVALDGAPVTDGNYNNYQYVAQTFVPNKENISGIKLKFNLTAGTAKIHTEIRSSIDGTALYSKDIDIQSLGDGGNWYTLNFGENFKVTPYESYYLIWYAVDRTASSLMINYATDNSTNTNPDAYMHGMGTTTFSKASNLTFAFELITDEYTPFSFAKWTDEDAVINGVSHVALDGAPVTDSNYNNYYYAAQTFVPNSDNISGVKLEFNLTAGTATIHIEIRDEVNGSAIFSKDIGVESLGNGGYWYTFNFEDNVSLTPYEDYCLVWYATQRTDTSLMLNYATDNSANTNPDAYIHKMGETTFSKVSNLTFGFELITDEYIPFSFAKWTDEDAVINGVNHVALDGAPVTDGNYNNYQYVAQTFIPNKNNISGVKLMFNLTAGTAKIHTEIRSSIDGIALYSKDIDIQSLGDGGNWYTLDFGENVEVTPYQNYYLVWYAVDRTASSIMINYATNNPSNTNPDSYLHGMGKTTFEKNSSLTFGFELITDEYTPYSFVNWTEEDAVINGVNHVALDGAPVTDGNYNNYYYVAQTFIPDKDNISGVKLMFNLTAGTAKIHTEIRSSVNGTALYSKDVDIESLGNGGYWYTLNFGEDVEVTPYQNYYLVWYAVDRTSTSLLINYATDNSANTNPTAYSHGMTSNTFTSVFNLTYAFQIITDVTGNPAVSAVKRVVDAINALPATDSITLDNEDQIKNIRSMYTDLTETQKAEVTNYNLLVAAEAKLNDLYAQETINGIIDDIDALPETSALSLVFEDDVNAIRLLYNDLTAARKELVTNYNTLEEAEQTIAQLKLSLIDTADATKMSENISGNMTAYGLPIGWKINPGQTNNWLLYGFNNNFGEGKYKLAVKVKFENITSTAPVISMKTTDNSDGSKEVLKNDLGFSDYGTADKDENGFAMLYTDEFNVTAELATHELEGKVLVYNEFHGTDAVIIFAGVYWVDANDTSVIYKNVTDFANYDSKVLTGTTAYSDLINHVEYAYDSSKETTAELGYTITGLDFGKLDAGKYYAELEYSVPNVTSGAMFDIEVYADGTKIKSITAAVSDYNSAVCNSDGHCAIPVDFDLQNAAGVIVKIYQYNAATVDYYNLRMFRTELYVDKDVEAVIALINALPSASNVKLDDETAILAANSAYTALTDAQKGKVTNHDKLVAVLEALRKLKLGDINNDGTISAADALLALQCSVSKITLDENQTAAADVNKDGKITANDALLILQYSVGKISSF